MSSRVQTPDAALITAFNARSRASPFGLGEFLHHLGDRCGRIVIEKQAGTVGDDQMLGASCRLWISLL